MFRKSEVASFLFVAALTLGLITITLWNFAADQAFFIFANNDTAQLSEVLETTIYQAVCSILLIATVTITVGQMMRKRSFNWIWYNAIVLCLLANSVFLIFPLARKAYKNGQKRWIGPALCLGLPLTLLVDNLARLYNSYGLFLPDHFSILIGFLWDAAPFLGLSALVLTMLARERNQTLPRKIWWVGLLITITLSLDLPTIVAEIRAVLANAPQIGMNTFFISMHFWPALPIAVISVLSSAILVMIAALAIERRMTRALVFFPLVEERAEQPEMRLEPDGMGVDAEFEVEISNL